MMFFSSIEILLKNSTHVGMQTSIQEFLSFLQLPVEGHDFWLLEQALTHKTFAMDFKEPKLHQERLEFLGDAILGATIAAKLYTTYADKAESQLTIAKIHLVREGMLAKVARSLGLWNYLRLGSGETRSGGAQKDVILADGLESLIAYIYLQFGWQETYNFIMQRIWPEFPWFEQQGVSKSYKNLLQERVQRQYKELPVYIDTEASVESSGNITSFQTEVFIQWKSYWVAIAQNKKKAQEEAAKAALEKLGL
jgi:ribonuclease III